MSKETIKMKSIRINRIGIKNLLSTAENLARLNRGVIAKNWDKESDAECRKALYKAHRGLTKSRAIIRECQAQLRSTKLELRKLNRQHDIRVKAISEHLEGYNQTGLLG